MSSHHISFLLMSSRLARSGGSAYTPSLLNRGAYVKCRVNFWSNRRGAHWLVWKSDCRLRMFWNSREESHDRKKYPWVPRNSPILGALGLLWSIYCLHLLKKCATAYVFTTRRYTFIFMQSSLSCFTVKIEMRLDFENMINKQCFSITALHTPFLPFSMYFFTHLGPLNDQQMHISLML